MFAKRTFITRAYAESTLYIADAHTVVRTSVLNYSCVWIVTHIYAAFKVSISFLSLSFSASRAAMRSSCVITFRATLITLASAVTP